MDTKAYHNLDPKLKAAYDRIMGTATPNTGTTHHETPAPSHHSEPSKPHQALRGHLSHLAYNAATASKSVTHKVASPKEGKNDSLILPIVLGIAGVVFFIFYAFFWLNFFGMTTQ